MQLAHTTVGMLDCVVLRAVHSTLHILLYLVPRWVHTLLVELSVKLWQLVTGRC